MAEFWEANFIEKQTMWGFEPSESAITAKDLFLKERIEEVLIPGIGYGRNARVFLDNGIKVTGIEISKTAIKLANEQNELNIKIYHGSVMDMPFDNKFYGGIFSYALIHLLNSRERKKFIRDCYNQLMPNGYMIFSTISKRSPMFGQGKKLSTDRFETMKGVQLFFYDQESINREFGMSGLIESYELDEPIKFMKNHPPLKFSLIICKK